MRLELGDTDSAAALFTDEELGIWIAQRGTNALLIAADACDALATRYARAFNFQTDGQRFDRASMAEMYRKRAADLRARASGVQTIDVTRVDGYSTDIAAQDVLTTSQNPMRRYYGTQDEPY